MSKLSLAPFSLAAAIILSSLAIAQAGKPDPAGPLASKIDAEISGYVKNGFSGAVLVAKNNQIVLNKVYGSAAASSPEPAFWIASNSKSFTAAAILKLQEQGKLSVNDPLSNFFPEAPADKSQITLRDLLSHTSGMPDKYTADGMADRDAAAKAILAVPLEWKVGEGYHYSNDGYTLLAIIVELTSKMHFEDYLKKEIFHAAKLRHTGFWGFAEKARLAPLAAVNDAAKVSPTVYKSGVSIGNWGYRGATGIYSTTADLFKWMRALNEGKVLSATSRDQLWGKQAFLGQVSPIEEAFYGYGWGVRFRNGKRFYVRHLGDDGWSGHNAAMCLYSNGDAYVVLSNAGNRDDDAAWSLVIARYLHTQLEK